MLKQRGWPLENVWINRPLADNPHIKSFGNRPAGSATSNKTIKGFLLATVARITVVYPDGRRVPFILERWGWGN